MKFPYGFTALQPPLSVQITNDCKLQSLKNDGWNPRPFEVIECFFIHYWGQDSCSKSLEYALEWHSDVQVSHMHMHHEPAKSAVKRHPPCGRPWFLEPKKTHLVFLVDKPLRTLEWGHFCGNLKNWLKMKLRNTYIFASLSLSSWTFFFFFPFDKTLQWCGRD